MRIRLRLLLALFMMGQSALAFSSSDQGMAILKSRCISCHDISGPAPTTLKEIWARQGPDLFYAGNKYKGDWLASWLQKPRRIRPAGMFYANVIVHDGEKDEIDVGQLRKHLRLSKADAIAVRKTLMTLKPKQNLIKQGDYRPGKISLTMGEMMFDKFRGCLACHEIEPGYGGRSGQEVYSIARRLQSDYIVSYLRNPQAWDGKTLMPSIHLKESDLQKLVHYFHALSKENY